MDDDHTLDSRQTDKQIDYQTYTDLKEKYDALYQQFQTLELEKHEYEKEMKQMVNQNQELKESNSANLEALELDEHTKLSVQVMSAALYEADSLQQEVSAQNDEYKDLTDKLTDENDILREQKRKYVLKLENMKDNVQKKELEYQNKIEMLETKMKDLNNEQTEMAQKYEQLTNEMNKLKQATDEQLKQQMEVSSPAPDISLHSHNKTVYLKFLRSIKSLPDTETIFGGVYNDSIPNDYNYGGDGINVVTDEMNVIKEQLRKEYEEKLNYEKQMFLNEHIAKHTSKIKELNEQIVLYKKKLMEKNIYINKMKYDKLNNVENGRNGFNKRPNNQQDLSKCKVFGWTAW